jgi:hypothetical protein
MIQKSKGGAASVDYPTRPSPAADLFWFYGLKEKGPNLFAKVGEE